MYDDKLSAPLADKPTRFRQLGVSRPDRVRIDGIGTVTVAKLSLTL
jgi:hypothetical protein